MGYLCHQTGRELSTNLLFGAFIIFWGEGGIALSSCTWRECKFSSMMSVFSQTSSFFLELYYSIYRNTIFSHPFFNISVSFYILVVIFPALNNVIMLHRNLFSGIINVFFIRTQEQQIASWSEYYVVPT